MSGCRLKPDAALVPKRMNPESEEPTNAGPEPAPLKNSLYRKVTRGRRKLTRGRLLLYRVAVVLAWWLVRALWASCRVTHVAARRPPSRPRATTSR